MSPTQSWPKTLPEKPPTESKAQAATQWTAQDIEMAQARCTALLKGLNVVVVPETPLREGTECGTPAPMKLVSIGKNPQVALSPPPTVTCDMVTALHRWLERDIQPLARKRLGAPVIRIETMSSYSCRNAYGRAGSRLSEHGRANAIDIGAFITAHGQAAMVVADWGMTAREIAAQAVAGKDAVAKAPAEKVQPSVSIQAANPQSKSAVQPPSAAALQPVEAGVRLLRPGMAIGIPGVSIQMPGQGSGEFGLSQPSRLGGPKPPAQAAGPLSPGDKMDFLRSAHGAACKIFGTVLGPEVNSAHKNHFHVDMADRVQNTKICE